MLTPEKLDMSIWYSLKQHYLLEDGQQRNLLAHTLIMEISQPISMLCSKHHCREACVVCAPRESSRCLEQRFSQSQAWGWRQYCINSSICVDECIKIERN